MSRLVHSPDPTTPLPDPSPRTGLRYTSTTRCVRKPRGAVYAVHPKLSNIDCTRCLALAGYDRDGRPLPKVRR